MNTMDVNIQTKESKKVTNDEPIFDSGVIHIVKQITPTKVSEKENTGILIKPIHDGSPSICFKYGLGLESDNPRNIVSRLVSIHERFSLNNCMYIALLSSKIKSQLFSS